MSSSDLEGLVAAFLAARENDPALAPEAFAAAHPDCEAALLRAIRNTLDVDELLPPTSPPPASRTSSVPTASSRRSAAEAWGSSTASSATGTASH